MTAVASERKGYRRGLILGLTMAESMLLLVFCLLLVAAAIISQQRKENEEALRKMSDQVQLLKQNENALIEANEEFGAQLVELQAQAAGNTKISENWSELNFARKLVQKYKGEGVSGDQLFALVEEVKAVIAMQAQGISETDLKSAQTDLVLVDKLKAEGITSQELERLAPALVVLKEKQFAKLEAAEVKEQLAQAIDKNSAAPETAKAHQWPPIINLSEAEGYSFNVGSAQLDKKLKEQLEGNITTKLTKLLNDYDVDLIEVIGHTDEQPLAGVPSNMDRELNPVLSGKADVAALRPGDNAGLGLARAVAVAQVLQRQPGLKNATVLPYSAAQLILPGDRITQWVSKDDKSRRRIEIRVRRRGTPEALH
ncbi:OmpA family protein [Mesorhizobium sp. M0808]|uniref:hypothetical protein n=1 Tax=unclassified Mesorhizobium TaxID=325217 RepID=UPI00333D7E68